MFVIAINAIKCRIYERENNRGDRNALHTEFNSIKIETFAKIYLFAWSCESIGVYFLSAVNISAYSELEFIVCLFVQLLLLRLVCYILLVIVN